MRILQNSLSSPAKAGDPVNAGVSILINAAEYCPAFAGHDGKGFEPRNDGYCLLFGTTRNVPLARAITTSSALIKLCAKQIVLPVLITSVSTVSHCPTCAVPMKSIASPIVSREDAPPITCAQLCPIALSARAAISPP